MFELFSQSINVTTIINKKYNVRSHANPKLVHLLAAFGHMSQLQWSSYVPNAPLESFCWTLWGSRRDVWIQPGHGPRDVFGFAVEEDTMVVLTSAPWIKDPFHTGFVQQVDYPHGLRFQQYTHLHMINDEFDCHLESVVSVRAVLHFLHLWQ